MHNYKILERDSSANKIVEKTLTPITVTASGNKLLAEHHYDIFTEDNDEDSDSIDGALGKKYITIGHINYKIEQQEKDFNIDKFYSQYVHNKDEMEVYYPKLSLMMDYLVSLSSKYDPVHTQEIIRQTSEWIKDVKPVEKESIQLFSKKAVYTDPPIYNDLQRSPLSYILASSYIDDVFQRSTSLSQDVTGYKLFDFPTTKQFDFNTKHGTSFDFNSTFNELIELLRSKLAANNEINETNLKLRNRWQENKELAQKHTISEDKFKENLQKFQNLFTGRSFIEHGYITPNLHPQIESMLSEDQQNPMNNSLIIMKFFIPKGIKAISLKPVSTDEGESRLLLPRGMEYKITKMEWIPLDNDFRFVITTEVKPKT